MYILVTTGVVVTLMMCVAVTLTMCIGQGVFPWTEFFPFQKKSSPTTSVGLQLPS